MVSGTVQTQSVTGLRPGCHPGMARSMRRNVSLQPSGRSQKAELNRGRTLAGAPADRGSV